jgi:hypothetical protein
MTGYIPPKPFPSRNHQSYITQQNNLAMHHQEGIYVTLKDRERRRRARETRKIRPTSTYYSPPSRNYSSSNSNTPTYLKPSQPPKELSTLEKILTFILDRIDDVIKY